MVEWPNPLDYTPDLRTLQNAANARGETGPLDNASMREAHQLGFAEGYAAGLEAAAKACEGDKTQPRSERICQDCSRPTDWQGVRSP